MATAMPIFSNVSFKDGDWDYLPPTLNDSFRERFARNFDRLKIFVFVSVIRQRWNLADDAFGEKYLFDLVLGDWPPFRPHLNVSLESFEQALLFCWRQFLDLGE